MQFNELTIEQIEQLKSLYENGSNNLHRIQNLVQGSHVYAITRNLHLNDENDFGDLITRMDEMKALFQDKVTISITLLDSGFIYNEVIDFESREQRNELYALAN